MPSNDEYKSISCNFYDLILARATFKSLENITYLDPQNKQLTVESKIIDVFTKEKAEYLKLEQGTIIRLDKIISIGKDKLSDYESCKI
ncbi:MAG: hypothetical protein GY810_24350 [Aureispira sp.]|nr:hypothetical protein [Aureispira sp.]